MEGMSVHFTGKLPDCLSFLFGGIYRSNASACVNTVIGSCKLAGIGWWIFWPSKNWTELSFVLFIETKHNLVLTVLFTNSFWKPIKNHWIIEIWFWNVYIVAPRIYISKFVLKDCINQEQLCLRLCCVVLWF